MDDARKHLTPHLLSGEQLLWTGRPDPGKHLTRQDLYVVPFTLVWAGFAVFWLVTVLRAGAPLPFALFGVPFVLLGLYVVAGRFVVKARRKRRTVYGLTGRRALVVEGQGSVSESRVADQQISVRRSRDGGHVDVAFGRSDGSWFSGPSYANTGMEFFTRGDSTLAFHDVPDVAGLERALRQVER